MSFVEEKMAFEFVSKCANFNENTWNRQSMT